MLSVIVKIIDRLVPHQVLIAEEETVKTKTVCEFEIVKHRPFVLSINTKLVETHAGRRICFSVVTIGQADNRRSGLIEEIVKAVIAVVTGTVSHVGVVGHLILVACSESGLVVTGIVGKVILAVMTLLCTPLFHVNSS